MKRTLLFIFLSLFFFGGCSSWRAGETLKDIESYIMERPDSALTVLDTMDRDLLTTDRLRARHALLHAMALDKNFIDVDDDSLASIAVEYYSKKGPDKYYARSLYYLGLSYYYAQDYKKAILEFTKAEKVAERSDSLYWGMTKSLQSNVYIAFHNNIEALNSLKRAHEIYTDLSLDYYVNVSELELAKLYFNHDEFLIADSLFNKLIISDYTDNKVRIYANKYKAFMMASQFEPDFTVSTCIYDTLIKEHYNSYLTNKDYWAYAFSLNNVGRKEESKEIISQLKQLDTSGTADYWMYMIEKSNGNSEEALKYLERSTTKIDKEVNKALQQSLALSQRDYYKTEYKNAEYKARNRQLAATSIGISSVLILVLVLWGTSVYVRRQREEKEYYLNYADEIRRQLEASKKDDYPQLKRKYLEISKSRFEMIASLYEEYVLYRGKKNAEHAVYTKVSEIISDFISDNANKTQLESVLNESLDGIISKLREEMPRFKEIDYSIFSFMLIGFDVTTISHFLNVSMNAVYIRKSRMKQRIEETDSEYKERFLEVLGR